MALSLRQPWAYAILYRDKLVENRTWFSPHRGRLILHASKTWDQDGWEWLADRGYEPPYREVMKAEGMLGALVGEVLMTGCRRVEQPQFDHDVWACGPWCWTLQHPVPYIRPLPWIGHQGLFPVDLTAAMICGGGAR